MDNELEKKIQVYRDLLKEVWHEFCDETQFYLNKKLKEIGE